MTRIQQRSNKIWKEEQHCRKDQKNHSMAMCLPEIDLQGVIHTHTDTHTHTQEAITLLHILSLFDLSIFNI
jgi:hypothetical protein